MPFYQFEDKRPRVDSASFIHPMAVLIGDVEVEQGCYIGAGAVLRGDFGAIKVGWGSNIQDNCVLHAFPDASVILHSEVHIGHTSILHGCEICSHVLIGMGSIISDDAKINSKCLIAAGTFIPAKEVVPENSLVMGSPGKVVRELTPQQLEALADGRAEYQNLAKRCLRSFREIARTECAKGTSVE